jgi:hypothetical protein
VARSRIEIKILAERAVPLKVDDDLVMSGDELQTLKHTVEIVDHPGSIAIDIDEAFAWRHLQANATERIAAEETGPWWNSEDWIRIRVPLPPQRGCHVGGPGLAERKERIVIAAEQQRRSDDYRTATAVPLSVCGNDGKSQEENRAGDGGEIFVTHRWGPPKAGAAGSHATVVPR